jgi:two-component system osmolarity sensor histidine kinase EnvZ
VSRLLRSYTAQLLLYAAVLLMAMGLIGAVTLHAIALEPSAEHSARTLAVLALTVDNQLAHNDGRLGSALREAGVFLSEPEGGALQSFPLPFPSLLRERLSERLGRPVQLRRNDGGEVVLWLPAAPTGAAFGLRYEPLRGPVARVSVVLLVLLGSLLLVATWFAARWLSRPLRRLSDALPAMVAGAPSPRLGRFAPAEIEQLAAALAEAMRRLREQSEARELALAGISHDLRTPLMRMALQLQMIPAHPRLAQIEQEIAEMDQLIAAALELARAGRQEAAQWLAPRQLLARMLEQDPRWQLEVDQDLQLLAPPIALRRTLDNLIQNALRHGAAPYRIAQRRLSGSLQLIVEDHGGGGATGMIADLRQLREGADQRGGPGLGLAIVERLAASFEAELTIERDAEAFRMVLSVPLARVRVTTGQSRAGSH